MKPRERRCPLSESFGSSSSSNSVKKTANIARSERFKTNESSKKLESKEKGGPKRRKR